MNIHKAKNQADLPPLPTGFIYRLDLARAATPRLLKKRPRHRWFWFPHSYSPELVEAILESWNLPSKARILDPFVGAGTTLLVARELGFTAAEGVDLSPLSVRASRVKTADYDERHMKRQLESILNAFHAANSTKNPKLYTITSERLRKAFTELEYTILQLLQKSILSCTISNEERDFFLLALLTTAQAYSRAVADGGWFRWVEREESKPQNIISFFRSQVQSMLSDLATSYLSPHTYVTVYQGDARRLDILPGRYHALITSPPYPNRHDYSRVFHIELLLLGEDETSIKHLRYTSLRSHVEAKPPPIIREKESNKYQLPNKLGKVLAQFPPKVDKRVPLMLQGYFEDMYHVLNSAHAVLYPGAEIALVVGNVRHAGVLIPVDEILIEIGTQVGYEWKGTWVIRLRGNSAQQMGRFGRVPARESVIFFKKPTKTNQKETETLHVPHG